MNCRVTALCGDTSLPLRTASRNRTDELGGDHRLVSDERPAAQGGAGLEQAAQELGPLRAPLSLIGVDVLFEPGNLIEAEVTAVLA